MSFQRRHFLLSYLKTLSFKASRSADRCLSNSANLAAVNTETDRVDPGMYGVHLRTKITENKRQFEVQKLDYPCQNLVI